ncbi:NAD(P)-dependent oxidoreductase [Candidatus Micrarchaeota archaeon]|nr:NAD(P)-dependent oxidoreductase [Candidatus Micrarchaeota archaeon]MBU1165859.1 NAD(P)-dependent oxidoreductase [Candidatus Micrarchaeota archaeon]MBU1887021.1 NAD(P)-dependent oxidoreductase [Candidatus Micrarchaeota archaeon]
MKAKVVVFGGGGFIGSHVADELTARGCEVTIFDIKKSRYVQDKQKMVVGDMLDPEKVLDTIKGTDYVYNFAGVSDLQSATTMPVETIKYNILGTANILEACRQANVKRFVFASTIYVYSERGGFYRCSKQATELYIEEYKRKYGLDFTILRYGTVYGPRTDERNSIYRYLKQALVEKKIEWVGTGDELREYIHVKDVAKLSVDILDGDYKNQHINITGHHPTKFMDMLATINEILGGKVEIKLKKPEPGGSHYNMTPYSFSPKIGKKLVANPYTDLGQGLLEVLEEIQKQEHVNNGNSVHGDKDKEEK